MEETPIKDLIDEWPHRRDFADAVGVPVARVHKWAGVDRIPARFHSRVISAAQAKGFKHVTAEWMVEHHAEPATIPLRGVVT